MPEISPQVQLLVTVSASEIVLKRITVRVHSNVGRYPWARLWYLLRGFDVGGSGLVQLPLEILCDLLNVSVQTIYRWLQDGEAMGAFRKYRVRRGNLEVYLGSLTNVCWHLNLRNWGEVAEVPLLLVNSKIRAVVTGIVTQSKQQKSRYAANSQLKPEYRKAFGAPHPNELLGDIGQSSPKLAVGEVPYVLHMSESRVFVSKSFIHFGVSQVAIGHKLGLNERTVRRHLSELDIESRQICQRKHDYAWIKRALEHESTEFYSWDNDNKGRTTHVGYRLLGNQVHFSDGIPLGAKKQVPNEYDLPAADFERKLFKCGGQWWLARCNVYREEFSLKTMRAARRRFKWELSQCHFQKKSTGP
ncbi:MAG: RepA [Scytonema sp. PMC 1069.18]|nr:RepA [Scytonema sp. PMC 1069.18]MEC4888092.1 RepA [Scytonema sp. PMC 1070.18]